MPVLYMVKRVCIRNHHRCHQQYQSPNFVGKVWMCTCHLRHSLTAQSPFLGTMLYLSKFCRQTCLEPPLPSPSIFGRTTVKGCSQMSATEVGPSVAKPLVSPGANFPDKGKPCLYPKFPSKWNPQTGFPAQNCVGMSPHQRGIIRKTRNQLAQKKIVGCCIISTGLLQLGSRDSTVEVPRVARNGEGLQCVR